MMLLFVICSHNLYAGSFPSVKDISWSIEKSHAWRPPFGLDRVGNSMDVVIRRAIVRDLSPKIKIRFLKRGKEINHNYLSFPDKKSEIIRQNIPAEADEVVLFYEGNTGKQITLGRKKVLWAQFECDATTQPEKIINPVDMGAILVPADWLLLQQGEKSIIQFAAINRANQTKQVELNAWFESDQQKTTSAKIALRSGRKEMIQLLSPSSRQEKNDTLNIVLTDENGVEVWKKQVPTMISQPIPVPQFGVVTTKLRYDVPILNIVNGKNEPLQYANAWKDDKSDYIVCLPNGSRWVFWRGASYIPIWASKYNTGLSYEWAERISPNDGFTDCPEPLMDKELRYGNVAIIESSPSRIHIRWSYQSCDFNYKVNGDYAREDYYFYPDGTGIRALTLTSIPQAEYEVAEFILLASQASVPFDVMPENPLRLISFKTGEQQLVSLPEKDTSWKTLAEPVIYSMKLHRNEPMSAFSFNPMLTQKPFAFGPFYDKGLTVTPAYWGGHWPLSQGFNTGRSINESLWAGPSHNSLITWAVKRPAPIRSEITTTRDALGVLKQMRTETWTWLIGMTDAAENDLLHTAFSYAEPPLLTVKGGRCKPEVYSLERKALQIIAESASLHIRIQPVRWTVNPVFEIAGGAKQIQSIKIGDKNLAADEYRWDGKTLWVKTALQEPTNLSIGFSE
ncbi:MAG: hypothetical protein QM763_04105 [Agriterribacter sp.]